MIRCHSFVTSLICLMDGSRFKQYVYLIIGIRDLLCMITYTSLLKLKTGVPQICQFLSVCINVFGIHDKRIQSISFSCLPKLLYVDSPNFGETVPTTQTSTSIYRQYMSHVLLLDVLFVSLSRFLVVAVPVVYYKDLRNTLEPPVSLRCLELCKSVTEKPKD